ncbi:MAG: flagellar assembly peptidoglycan hydrolase FlgJ [Burkholderiaceae bacterium]
MDTASLGIDSRSLDKLRKSAGENPREAVRQAAEQFEALFMRQLLKTMRASIPENSLTNGPGGKMAQEMLDDQLTASMVGQPGGLSETLVKHLSRYMPEGESTEIASQRNVPSILNFRQGAPAAANAPGRSGSQSAQAVSSPGSGVSFSRMPSALVDSLTASRAPVATTPEAKFVQRLWEHASAAEQATGVPAAFILGQAALESGWGRGEMHHPDGRPAHNLFGIKAGSRWTGETVDITTTEFIDGKKTRQVERFRAYESYEESFNDWVGLMTRHPRYQGVLSQAGTAEEFARGLQSAGYATDPQYADKLNRVIQKTVQLQAEFV